MQPTAQIVHQSRGRIRLRISQKRKDLPYFLALYDDLRQAPGVEDLSMNPRTGSVLVYFDEEQRETLADTLAQCKLLDLADASALSTEAQDETGGETSRFQRFLNGKGKSATGPRAVLFLIMVGFAVQQYRKGHLWGPALTVLIYAADLIYGFKKETDPPAEKNEDQEGQLAENLAEEPA